VSGEYWLACAAGGAAPAEAAEGELAAWSLRPVVLGDGAATGTVTAATGEIAAAGTLAAFFTELPWLGSTVITTAAVAAASVRSVIAPVNTPARKLTSSSRALTAARMPGHEPTVR